jgi:hypothetical protein
LQQKQITPEDPSYIYTLRHVLFCFIKEGEQYFKDKPILLTKERIYQEQLRLTRVYSGLVGKEQAWEFRMNKIVCIGSTASVVRRLIGNLMLVDLAVEGFDDPNYLWTTLLRSAIFAMSIELASLVALKSDCCSNRSSFIRNNFFGEPSVNPAENSQPTDLNFNMV